MAGFKPVKLAYKIFQPNGGEDDSLCPIIFLHGLTASKEYWIDIPQVISDKTKRKVYALDARNHGDSEFTDEFNFEMNVDDLFHFMDTMNIEKTLLIGHSMGGITSIRAVLREPEKIEAIYVEDMYVRTVTQEHINYVLDFVRSWIEAVQNVPAGLSEEEALIHASHFLHSKLPPDQQKKLPKDMALYTGLRLRSKPDGTFDTSYNSTAVVSCLKNFLDVMKDPTGQYCGPATFIYGSLSPFQVGKEKEHIKEHFPAVEFIEFEGALHTLHQDFREKFINTVLKRLQN